jgi:hypothetical protein
MNTVRAAEARIALAFVGVCIALAVLAGCGGRSDVEVAGNVTYKGAPVSGGMLTLYPASGPSVPIPLHADGTFDTTGAPLGQVGVAVETDSPLAAQVGAPAAGATPPSGVPLPGGTQGSAAPPGVKIPSKYKDPKTSGLSWEIKAGANSKAFDLTD